MVVVVSPGISIPLIAVFAGLPLPGCSLLLAHQRPICWILRVLQLPTDALVTSISEDASTGGRSPSAWSGEDFAFVRCRHLPFLGAPVVFGVCFGSRVGGGRGAPDTGQAPTNVVVEEPETVREGGADVGQTQQRQRNPDQRVEDGGELSPVGFGGDVPVTCGTRTQSRERVRAWKPFFSLI